MQTTLLGLAIALILALLAALVGPYLIDWNQFRTPFEAEATRLLGAQVRVAGPLDARLLPTPSLRLQRVTVGGANDAGRIAAAKLDVEFSLGSLMRGELRADELSINGLSLDLGLDPQGRLDWPAAGLSNLAALTVDRLNLTGRIALHDAASRSNLELSDIAFSGELRAQAAALRGDGNFLLGGQRYPFRLSTSRAADGDAIRLRAGINQGAGGIAADLDGLVRFEQSRPRFDGTASLAALAAATGETPRTPWRLAAKVEADPALAKLDQVEVSWGADDRALKLIGSGEARFGAAPRLDAKLSARQLDADRLLAKPGDAAPPLPWLARLRDVAASLPLPSLLARVSLDADQITIGNRPVTDLVAELRGNSQAWQLERLELRAPGGTRLALRGGAGAADAAITGTLDLSATDPDLLAAWLQGRAPTAGSLSKALRIAGGVRAGSDALVLDPLTVQSGGDTLRGRFAYRARRDDQGTQIDAALKGDSADLDAALQWARTLAGSDGGWPEQASLTLDLGKLSVGDQVWQPAALRLAYDLHRIALDRLKLGTAGGLLLEGDGALDRDNATGRLALSTRAPSLGPIAAAIDPIAPAIAARLKALPTDPGEVRAKLALAVEKAGAARDHVEASGTLDLAGPQLSGRLTAKASPPAADLHKLDVEVLTRRALQLEGELSAPRGEALLSLLGLDRVIAAGDGAAVLHASGSGTWRGKLQGKAKLTAARLDAEANGEVEPFAAEPKASLSLSARKLDLAPLFDLPPSGANEAPLSFSTQLAVAGSKWTFKDIDAGIAGSRLRGRLALTRGETAELDGEAGIDTLPLGPALQLALGAAGRPADEPLGQGWLRGWRGKIAFQAVRAELPGGSELQPLSGVVRSDGRSLTLDSSGKLGGGDAKAVLTAKLVEAGVALDAQLTLKDADAAALRDGTLALPLGRLSLQGTLASSGRSASALAGALSGGGTVTLSQAAISGLDPSAFAVAIRAADQGQPIDADHLAKLVEPALKAGPLKVDSAQFPISISDGRLKLAPTTLQAKDARAVVSGGYDVAAGQADVRVTLISTEPAHELLPEIRMFAAGPPDRMKWSVDLSGLSSWLSIRRIDRETRKLQMLEQGGKPPVGPDPAAATQAPSNADRSPAQTSSLPPPAAPAMPQSAPTPTRVPAGNHQTVPKSAPEAAPQPNAPANGQDAAISPTQPFTPPLPDADPRRATPPKPRVQPQRPSQPQPQTPLQPQASTAASSTLREKLAPLPPPLEIKPAPGDTRPSRPRAPLVLSPPNARATD
ncbi:AsmA family protein [Rhodopseudomonas palustris]|uniref:AsmA family protein n=1 Tax=Rhodopseudomonas palustris TaxID=1076 RepID=UPI000E5BFE04|nr:AsmA family protein [Rhodopseudomonas palustris]QLH72517.1 AsmA family protein [Rhodopseudomonas palustris]RIA03694.1 AsmA family protein [Rhodopseudomonas palustris]